MTTRDPSEDAKPSSAGRDYESVGADIVVSHARDVMRTRISALRCRLRNAFAAPEKRKADESGEPDDS